MTKNLISARPRRNLALLGVALAFVASALLPQATAATAAPRHLDDHQLAALSNAVASSGVRGIAWYVDTSGNRVDVTADSTVSSSDLATLKQAAGTDATALRIDRVPGTFRPLLSGGDAIYGNRYRCSLGFNVVKGSTYYFLTAGHCGKAEKKWWTSASHATFIGPTVGYSFPGNDYALVRYDNTALTHPGGYTAANAFVGETVTRNGSTTGVHSGRVTALNVTVVYQGGGKVDGLIETTVCAEPGDSGGPLYDGSKALGLTSGGSGDCKKGGTTFFQPVVEAANVYGVTVY